jgi:hypothetical protein
MARSKRAKFLLIASIMLALPAGMVVGSPIAAHAQVKTQETPPVQVCNFESTLCMNRAGGGTKAGTQVIAYPLGNENNDFTFVWLGSYCGSGHVTASCPSYGDSSINQSLNGDIIGEIQSENGLCLALNGLLQKCSADGVVDVFADCGDIIDCDFSAVLNDYWTTANRSPRWVNFQTAPSTKIIIDGIASQLIDQVYTV